MMERPDKDLTFMQIAHVVRQRGTCQRAQVGCIITDEGGNSIVSMGYNGNARGLPNHCDSDEKGQCGCIHAEVNALIKAPFHQGHLTLYTTTSPCLACAKLILNSAVTTVYYDWIYRDRSGLTLLEIQLGKVDRVSIVNAAPLEEPIAADKCQHNRRRDDCFYCAD